MMGQCSLAAKNYAEAAEQFLEAAFGYPYEEWQCQAHFEAAKCFIELKDTLKARESLETVTKRFQNVERQLKSGRTKELEAELATLARAKTAVEAGTQLRDLEWTEDERKMLKGLSLLTQKPMLYVVNVSESQLQNDSWTSVCKLSTVNCLLAPCIYSSTSSSTSTCISQTSSRSTAR